MTGLEPQSMISIITMKGSLVKWLLAEGDKTLIDVSGLQNGVYLVKVQTPNGIMMRTFIKR